MRHTKRNGPFARAWDVHLLFTILKTKNEWVNEKQCERHRVPEPERVDTQWVAHLLFTVLKTKTARCVIWVIFWIDAAFLSGWVVHLSEKKDDISEPEVVWKQRTIRMNQKPSSRHCVRRTKGNEEQGWTGSSGRDGECDSWSRTCQYLCSGCSGFQDLWHEWTGLDRNCGWLGVGSTCVREWVKEMVPTIRWQRKFHSTWWMVVLSRQSEVANVWESSRPKKFSK